MHECEQMVQLLIQQTTHSYKVYEELRQQEQRNSMQLQELISNEKQAIHAIHTALQSHQQAVAEMQQVVEMYKQITPSNNSFSSNQTMNNGGQLTN